MKATAPDLIEAGVPSFAVLGPEALGLTTAPVDLQQLPDGRLLAVGHRELALGDGVRWEVFRQAEGNLRADTVSVAVDKDGLIYAGVPGGFARIDFGPDARWKYTLVAELPPEADNRTPALVNTIAVGGEWLWWWGSGKIFSWRPGSVPKVVGQANAPESAFLLEGKIHLSDGSNGALFRMEEGTFRLLTAAYSIRVDQTITSLVALNEGRALVGTISDGMQLAEGNRLRPLVTAGLLAGEHRINHICATEGGFFAAAVDNVGIVFFDREGRTIQVLDRSIDHRLAKVKRLLPTPGGVVWALLNEGIARVAFPNRISHFESLVSTGLAFVQPYRLNGQLWLLADGRALRGVYDEGHRLERFELDTPPGMLSSMGELDGSLVACSTAGIFLREPPGKWSLVTADTLSANLIPQPVAPGRWLYVAQDEVGWLKRTNGYFSVE